MTSNYIVFARYSEKNYTLGAETFASRNFRESLRREKFYIDRFAKVYACEIFKFFFISPNLLTAFDNALILVSLRKKSRR